MSELLDQEELLYALEVSSTDFDAVDITSLSYQANMKIKELLNRINRAEHILVKNDTRLSIDEITDSLLTNTAQCVDAYNGLDIEVQRLRKKEADCKAMLDEQSASHKQQKLELIEEVIDIIETERELNGAYEKVITLKQQIEDE